VSASNAFVWLTGTVTLPVDLPEGLKESGLPIFFEKPNDPSWGGALGRVLYHESIHFWQLLSSGYLANALAGEWVNLEMYERSGRISPSDPSLPLDRTRESDPFSVRELVECWARYWDVHTRSPATLIDEDHLDLADDRASTTTVDGLDGYTSCAFDLFMQEGKDAKYYARPYRWALAECDNDSAFTNIVFPILVFNAMGSRDPITLFVRSLQMAKCSSVLREGRRHRTGNINVDWLNWRSAVEAEAVSGARRELGLPAFTPGWDVIARGPLARHPILAPYVQRTRAFFRWAQTVSPAVTPKGSMDSLWQFIAVDQMIRHPLVAFMFPGDPHYRKELGRWLLPPRVSFRDITLHEETFVGATTMQKLAMLKGEQPTFDATFEQAYVDLDARVRRFRAAEYAVSLGLPADSFERRSP
jgi:hypothetical protein